MSAERRYTCLVSDLRGKAYSSSLIAFHKANIHVVTNTMNKQNIVEIPEAMGASTPISITYLQVNDYLYFCFSHFLYH